MLKTICYTSLHAKEIPAYQIEMLFHQVRTFNELNEIKGVLFSGFDRFFQIIEGPESLIDSLYESIKKDSRHKDISQILNTKINSYSFKDFGTGYNTIKSLDSMLGLQNYLSSPSFKSSSHAKIFLQGIGSFV